MVVAHLLKEAVANQAVYAGDKDALARVFGYCLPSTDVLLGNEVVQGV